MKSEQMNKCLNNSLYIQTFFFRHNEQIILVQLLDIASWRNDDRQANLSVSNELARWLRNCLKNLTVKQQLFFLFAFVKL